MAATRLTVNGLYRWGYSQGNRHLSFLTNVIQISCGHKAKKMKGLYKLVQAGHEVACAQFDMFTITIDGIHRPIQALENAEAIIAGR